MRKYLTHLDTLALNRTKRKEANKCTKSKKTESKYEDYDWHELVKSNTLKNVLNVELYKYLVHHNMDKTHLTKLKRLLLILANKHILNLKMIIMMQMTMWKIDNHMNNRVHQKVMSIVVIQPVMMTRAMKMLLSW